MQKCQLVLDSWRKTESTHETGLLSLKVRVGDRIFQQVAPRTRSRWLPCPGTAGVRSVWPCSEGVWGTALLKIVPVFNLLCFSKWRTALLRQRLQSAARIESYFWFRLWLFPGESLIDFLTFLWLIFPRLLKIVCTSASEAFWVLEIKLKLRSDCCHYNIEFQIISNLLKILCIWWM